MLRWRGMWFKKEMVIFASLGILLIAAGAAVSYLFLFRRPNPPLPANELKVGNTAFTVEIASTTIAQARGLSYRADLGENQGMLFVFSRPAIQNFWMKDMNFPIDMIWIGAGAGGSGEQVLGFAQNAAPQPGVPLWSLTIYNSPDGTDKVLEVKAGTVAKDGIQIGDAVRLGS